MKYKYLQYYIKLIFYTKKGILYSLLEGGGGGDLIIRKRKMEMKVIKPPTDNCVSISIT